MQILHAAEILSYDKQKDSPQIIFLTPRYDASRLPIDIKLLESRNDQKLRQMEAMIQYVENSRLCRSLYLQHYFGEKSDKECGICDICREKNKDSEDRKSLSQIRSRVVEFLGKSPMTINEITEVFPPHRKEVVIKVIRLMLDSQQLMYDDLNYLHLRENV